MADSPLDQAEHLMYRFARGDGTGDYQQETEAAATVMAEYDRLKVELGRTEHNLKMLNIEYQAALAKIDEYYREICGLEAARDRVLALCDEDDQRGDTLRGYEIRKALEAFDGE